MKPWGIGAMMLAALGLAAGASADGLSVAPGLWKSTSTIVVDLNALEKASLQTPTEVQTSESCLSNTAQVLNAQMLAGPECVPSDIRQSGDEMSFVLVCQRGDVTLYGSMTAQAFADGTETVAHMTLTGRSADGHEMQINAETVGERLGPCQG
ncbi:MAG: DUF3617 family protein [Pseudomonadota bacterium]